MLIFMTIILTISSILLIIKNSRLEKDLIEVINKNMELEGMKRELSKEN